MEDLKLFLKETEYCDFSDPAIQKIADDFKAKHQDQRDLAKALFYHVRDLILYRVGLWQKKASETLAERRGTCTNKANLLVALLRACGIPAGYGVMRVRGREYFGPVALKMFSERIGETSIHVYTFVFLDGKWIKCDCSDDEIFSKNTSYFNPQSQLINWDGLTDAPLNLKEEHVIKDEGPLSDIDAIISKKAKNAKGAILKLGNFYVDFLRQNEIRISKTSELIPLFKQWLKRNHFIYYCLFCIALLGKKEEA